MYRLFCEGPKNYLEYNAGETTNRLRITEPKKRIEEQLKLIKLLLNSPMYWNN